MISSIATVSGYGFSQVQAAALGNAVARTPDAAVEDGALSNALPRNLPFLPTRIAYDGDINRFVLQFRNTKDGEITGQIPANKSSQAYREAQRLRGENVDAVDGQRSGETDEGTATIGKGKASAAPVIGQSGSRTSGSGAPDGAVVAIGGGFGGSTPAPAAISSYSPPAPATQSSGRGTTA